MQLAKFLLPNFLLVTFFATPAFAKGDVTVEYKNGDSDVYSDVEIANTQDTLYFEAQDNSTLMISKKNCQKEGEILVCNQARLGLENHGVIEELEVEQIFLFINPTSSRQTIKGSQVILTPNTVLLEVLTKKGTYIVGVGKIDSTTRPQDDQS